MRFETLYDIRSDGCRGGFLALYGVVLILVTGVVWLRQRRLREVSAAPYGSPVGYLLALFALFTILAFVATWVQYWSLLARMSRGEAHSLEGVVDKFSPAPDYRGHERFRVGDRTFSYSRFQTQQGFHSLREDGGPIQQGVRVRLLYIDDHILRLEVAS